VNYIPIAAPAMVTVARLSAICFILVSIADRGCAQVDAASEAPSLPVADKDGMLRTGHNDHLATTRLQDKVSNLEQLGFDARHIRMVPMKALTITLITDLLLTGTVTTIQFLITVVI
jgi:hypothetical protein